MPAVRDAQPEQPRRPDGGRSASPSRRRRRRGAGGRPGLRASPHCSWLYAFLTGRSLRTHLARPILQSMGWRLLGCRDSARRSRFRARCARRQGRRRDALGPARQGPDHAQVQGHARSAAQPTARSGSGTARRSMPRSPTFRHCKRLGRSTARPCSARARRSRSGRSTAATRSCVQGSGDLRSPRSARGTVTVDGNGRERPPDGVMSFDNGPYESLPDLADGLPARNHQDAQR